MLQEVVELHQFAGIGGDAPHDHGEVGLGDLACIVEGLAVEGAPDEVDMLLDHGVVGIELDGGDFDLLLAEHLARAEAGTGRAGEELAHTARGAGDLAALAMDAHAIAEVIIHAEEVEHVAGVATGPAAEAEGADRRAAQEPDGDVDVMDMLFDDVVTGELGEVEPVTVHVVGVGVALGATTDPRHGAVPLDHAATERADGAGIDEGLVLHVRGVMATLGARHDGEALLLGFFAGGDDGAGTDRIDGDRLLDEAMLARGDGGGEVDRAERRRRGHEHEGAIGRHDLLVGVVTDEDLGRRKLVSLVEALRTILEGIRQGDDFGFGAEDLAGGDELTEGAGTTTAAADEGYLDLGGDRLSAEDRRSGRQSEAAKGHGGYEGTTLDGVFHDLRL